MNVTTALDRINYALRGTDDDAPTFGDDESNYWLSTLNSKKDEMYQDPKQRWAESYSQLSPNEPGTVATAATTTLTGTNTFFNDYRVGDTVLVDGETVRTIATITSDTVLTVTVAFSTTASAKTFTHTIIVATGVQTYKLPRTLMFPSDTLFVTTSDAIRRDYIIIKPQERQTLGQQVFISGLNPKTITFTNPILATEDIVGASLTMPGYFLPADLTLATDLLPFPDPNWGVMSSAAEIAFNDIIYEDKAGDINTKANALYRAMATANRAGTYNQPRQIPRNVSQNRIRDTRRAY